MKGTLVSEKSPSPESDAARSDPNVADQNRQTLKDQAEKRLEQNREAEKADDEQK